MKSKEEFIREVLAKLKLTRSEIQNHIYREHGYDDYSYLCTLSEQIKLHFLDTMIHTDPAMLVSIICWGDVTTFFSYKEWVASGVCIRGNKGTSWLLELAALVIISEIIG